MKFIKCKQENIEACTMQITKQLSHVAVNLEWACN